MSIERLHRGPRMSQCVIHNKTVYVADTSHERIVKLSLADGSQIGTPIGVGKLHSCEGVALDAGGNIWVADTAANRLVEFSAAGNVLQTFGSLGTGHGQFDAPGHLEVFDGKLYVSDMFNDRVEIFTLT